MSPCCPKCRARSWDLRTDTLEDGTVLQVARCIPCGWRAERAVERTMAATRAARAAAETDRTKQAGLKSAKTSEPIPCAVQGCDTMTTTGRWHRLCPKCGNSLHSWVNSARTRPAILQRINGFWYRRDQALIPADPGSLSAAAYAEATAGKSAPAAPPQPKPRARRSAPKASVWVDRCEGCHQRRPIKAWGLCFDCLEEGADRRQGGES